MRDAVRDVPELVHPAVTGYIAEGARRARQVGHLENAKKFEFWLGILSLSPCPRPPAGTDLGNVAVLADGGVMVADRNPFP